MMSTLAKSEWYINAKQIIFVICRNIKSRHWISNLLIPKTISNFR